MTPYRRTAVYSVWLAGIAVAAGLAVAGPQTAIAAAIEDTYNIQNNSGSYVRWECSGCSVKAKRGYPQTNFTTRWGYSSGQLPPYDTTISNQLRVTATYAPLNGFQTATVNFTQRCGRRPCNDASGADAYRPGSWSVTLTQAVIGAPYVTTTGKTSGPDCNPVQCVIGLNR